MTYIFRQTASTVARSSVIFVAARRAVKTPQWTRHLSHEVSAADLKFGQPVHETHPHLLKPGEITPEISAQEYHDRREKLAKLMPPNSVALIPSSVLKYRSGPVFHKFHQDTNFFYLTGFDEPEAVALIDNRSTHPLFTLFVRENDAKEELWEGARSGTIAARDVFNADAAEDVAHVSAALPSMLDGAANIYTDVPSSMRPSSSFERFFSGIPSKASAGEGVVGLLGRLKNASIQPASPIVAKLRVVKSNAEVGAMRYAGQVAGRAHTNVMRQHWESEKQLALAFKMAVLNSKCEDESYIPVVAGGHNALSIHYVQNNSLLSPDDMILIDAGAQYGGYISDITRTFPNSGKFSPAQKDLYEMVLRVQRSCVSLCREDAGLSLDKLHKIAEKGLRDGLQGLGFDVGGNAMSILFPHHVGHYIGLDVHDTPSIPRTEKLRTGMCVTVEPGVYVPDDERWPPHFRGIGVRIEDSICVESESPLILTTEAVKEVVDIEALRRDID